MEKVTLYYCSSTVRSGRELPTVRTVLYLHFPSLVWFFVRLDVVRLTPFTAPTVRFMFTI